MDTVEESSHTSSMVDDSFYIVKKCVRYVQTRLSLEKWCTYNYIFYMKIICVFCDLLTHVHCIANIELFGVKRKIVLFSGACWITYSLIMVSQTQISQIHLICQSELKALFTILYCILTSIFQTFRYIKVFSQLPSVWDKKDLIVVLYDFRRAVSSSSVDGICAMLNHASTVLEQDFREVLFSRVRAGFPSGFDLTQAYNMVQSSIQQGKLQSSDQEKAKTTFLVCVSWSKLQWFKQIDIKLLKLLILCNSMWMNLFLHFLRLQWIMQKSAVNIANLWNPTLRWD